MSRDAFRTFTHLLPEACLLVTADGGVMAANPAAERLTGRDRGQIEGKRLQDLVTDAPDDVESYLRAASRTRGPIAGALAFAGENAAPCTSLAGLVRPPQGGEPSWIMVRLKERASGSNRFRLLNDQVDRLSREIRKRRQAEREYSRILTSESKTRMELERQAEELERATARLERSQALLEESQRSARVGSWEWDVRTDTLTWSEELYRIYGLDALRDDISFERFQQLVHPEDRDLVQGAIGEAMESGGPFEFEHRIVRPDGSVRTLHGRGRVVVDESGGVVRMIGSGQDITERKTIEDRARFLAEAGHILTTSLDYEETLRRVADLAVPDISDWATVDVVQDGEIRRLAVAHPDPAKREMAEEVARRWPPDPDDPGGAGRVHRTGEPLLLEEIPDSLLEETARSEEHLAILRELGLRSTMVVPMIARGQILGAVTFVSAESGRRFDGDDLEFAKELSSRAALAVDNARLYGEAQAASRARDDVIAVVSHDLRSSLNAVLAGASLLLEVPLSDEKRQDQYRSIKRSAQRMESLTRDLLDITRIEAGHLRIEPGAEDPHALIDEALDAATFPAKDAGIVLDAEIPDGLPPVHVDRTRILQVLDNLLSNAIRHTPAGGRITVAALEAGEQVRFRVSDTGVGIEPDLRDHVFDRYYQTERADHGGAGLGLPIVKGIVEAHRGEVWLETEVGRGTTFFFTLPIASGENEDRGSQVA